jgi:aminopeptidase N
LVGAFSSGNQVRFHDASGEGYKFLADIVIALDASNGQTAARLVNPLGAWRRQNPARQGLMRGELQRILATPRLSRGTFEKASKGLA